MHPYVIELEADYHRQALADQTRRTVRRGRPIRPRRAPGERRWHVGRRPAA